MAHYECKHCFEVGCMGNCPESFPDFSASVPTAVVPRRTPRPPALPAEAAKPSGPIKSDGGSSGYYTLTIRNKHGQTFECETGDVIRALVNNDFNLGNIVKACRRVSEAQQGRGKQGIDPLYDLNKIIYFAEELKPYVTV